VRPGHALADLQLGVLAWRDDRPARLRPCGAAWLMGEGPERTPARRSARRSRKSIPRTADPAAGALLDRLGAMAESRCPLVGSAPRPILTHVTRIDKSWSSCGASRTPSTTAVSTCSRRPDGRFGFDEFRRDVEDAGAWTPLRTIPAPPIPRWTTPWAPPSKPWCGWAGH
jgi:hypothetical protein